ncbi:MAG: 16S rRNA (guanine(966)-N(2))-methyltransferase RsmD [Syntrophales bacterium]|nr:16S rRNA (guanine(966)-N(2))-methyltransferase RsmD [Syntrophales bacterium]MCK9528205.1 16S rRNA (guanine(966)-N(2))-methyltransferase RsmD [Syntrophales bacterium]MDX9921353.1 16S rRNA (guanine(966)-N(2))-methyltransferase RsmD [Syntrophales bacterium]
MPRGGTLRTTTDRVKEALFNILDPVKNTAFLDLFAGSGNVGIEALSRGAAQVTFIESNARHLAVIRKNLERCGFVKGFSIMGVSFDRGIALLEKRRERFNTVFADPPYEKDLVMRTLDVLGETNIFAPGGTVVVEHSMRERCADSGALVLEDERRYGDTVLSFLKFRAGGDHHE